MKGQSDILAGQGCTSQPMQVCSNLILQKLLLIVTDFAMTLSARFDKQRNLVTFTVTSSTTTADEFLAAYEVVLDDPALVRDMHSIWNLSHLHLSRIPVGEIRRLPWAINRLMRLRGEGFKAALVTSRSGDFALLRLYLGLLKLVSGVHMRLFTSESDAYDWIAKE